MKNTKPKIQENPRRPGCNRGKKNFKKLFDESKTVKGIKEEIQLEPDAKIIQQKGRPIPKQLQPAVGKEIEKLKKTAI